MSHTTTDNMTAETFEYTTADELRELLDDTPHPDEIDEALACLPLDLEAFHARMTAAIAAIARFGHVLVSSLKIYLPAQRLAATSAAAASRSRMRSAGPSTRS